MSPGVSKGMKLLVYDSTEPPSELHLRSKDSKGHVSFARRYAESNASLLYTLNYTRTDISLKIVSCKPKTCFDSPFCAAGEKKSVLRAYFAPQAPKILPYGGHLDRKFWAFPPHFWGGWGEMKVFPPTSEGGGGKRKNPSPPPVGGKSAALICTKTKKRLKWQHFVASRRKG